MATKTLTFDVFGRDRGAVKTINRVSGASQKLSGTLLKLGGVFGVAFSAREIINFGRESVTAFTEAQEAQATLADAFSRFPALADTNQASLQKLNSTLALKTGYDDDAAASAQAVLAQFGLTGDQIKRLTPLLEDYARKTKQDLPTAAEALGKSLLGNTKALKAVGIDFKDSGDLATNYDLIVAGLTEKVGGYAEVWGTTAAGKFEILNTKFGEMQEEIGESLLPALEDFADFAGTTLMPHLEDIASWLKTDGIPGLQTMANFLEENGPLVIGFGAVTTAALAFNAAADVNPYVLAFMAMAGAVTWLTYNIDQLVNHTDDANRQFFGLTVPLTNWVLDAGNAIYNVVAGAVNGVIDMINGASLGMHNLLAQFGIDASYVTLSRIATSSGYSGEYYQVGTSFAGNVGPVKPSQNAELQNGRTGGKVTVPKKMAMGNVVMARPGGVPAVIGEGRYDEAVLPLNDQVLGTIGESIAAASDGLGGDTYNFTAIGTDPSTVTQMLYGKFRGTQAVRR